MIWLLTLLQQNSASPTAAAVAASFLGLGPLVGMAVAGQLVAQFGPVAALFGPLVFGAAATVHMGLSSGSQPPRRWLGR
jgi:hypothetical protein